MTSSFATPGFSWALPPEESKKETPTTKPLANPLLNHTFAASSPPATAAAAATSFRVPFSQVENVGMRRRSTTYEPSLTKKPIRPPTSSFLSNTVVSNELMAAHSTTTTTNQHSTTTLAIFTANNTTAVADASSSRVPLLMNESFLEHWVLVSGFSSASQYEAILRRFETFGLVVNQRSGINWVALQYDTLLQTEMALSQHPLVVEGIVICVTRLSLQLQQSLEWNAHSLSFQGVRKSTSHQHRELVTEHDILLLTETAKSSSSSQAIMITSTEFHGERRGRNICERFMAWWFGW